MKTFRFTPCIFVCLAILRASSGAEPAPPLVGLTLESAMARAESAHPELARAAALAEAAQGRVESARAFPNPEAIVAVEEFRGGNSGDYLAGVAQTVPLGGKRAKAVEAEKFRHAADRTAVELTRQRLRQKVHSAFATALYQENAWNLLRDLTAQLERVATVSKALLDAGDAVPSDLALAELAMLEAKAEALRAETFWRQSLADLALAMGDPGLQISSLAGDLESSLEIPAIESFAASLGSHPENLLAHDSVNVAEAEVRLAKARRVPDIKVEALYRRMTESNAHAVDLALGIEIPLFDRHRGRIREARADLAAAQAQARLTRDELQARALQARRELDAALARNRSLQTEILPRVQTLLTSAEARFDAGDISLPDLLSARRRAAEAQLARLESLRDILQAWAALSYFAAAP